jgi:hypothetical protein
LFLTAFQSKSRKEKEEGEPMCWASPRVIYVGGEEGGSGCIANEEGIRFLLSRSDTGDAPIASFSQAPLKSSSVHPMTSSMTLLLPLGSRFPAFLLGFNLLNLCTYVKEKLDYVSRDVGAELFVMSFLKQVCS